MKRKLLIPVVLIGLVVLATIVYFLYSSARSEKRVTIIDYTYSVCTADYPTSTCGPYDVTAQRDDGKNVTYQVAGFSNQKSKLYDEITVNVTKAKDQKSKVLLKINYKNEIISVK